MTRPGLPLAFIECAIHYSGDDCLLWPYARNSAGYAHLYINGVDTLAHRHICKEINGPPPQDRPEAAHTCGNGHLGCVNGRHLQWKNRSGNIDDMILHGHSQRGEKMWMSLLTEDDVRTIRSLHLSLTTSDIAKKFGISYGVVYHVLKRNSWAWVKASP